MGEVETHDSLAKQCDASLRRPWEDNDLTCGEEYLQVTVVRSLNNLALQFPAKVVHCLDLRGSIDLTAQNRRMR